MAHVADDKARRRFDLPMPDMLDDGLLELGDAGFVKRGDLEERFML